MIDISTSYMGIELENPLIVASCGLVRSIEGVRRADKAGPGAIVLKSLFEEQIMAENLETDKQVEASTHPEAVDYIRSDMGMQQGASDYIRLIEKCKKEIKTPVLASINCVSAQWWTRYASRMADAGADGIELNISRMPVDFDTSPTEIEKEYLTIVQQVTSQVDIPVAVKIGPFFTSLAHFVRQLTEKGASAIVLFNRFYQPDIDPNTCQLTAAHPFSSEGEIIWSLRSIAMLAKRLPCDLAASTGVHDANGLIKQLLAGATAVQACSTFYLNGLENVKPMLEGLRSWMQRHDLHNLDEVRDRMQPELSEKPEIRERLQYIKMFGGVE
jgi:dihydroorotate dehydrogenase (fumarate)